MDEYYIDKVLGHKWKDGVLFFNIHWKGKSETNSWERDDVVGSNQIVEKYKKENNLKEEITSLYMIKNNKIAEIVGIYRDSVKKDGIRYVVRVEKDTHYIIVPSEELQKYHPNELIDFLEASIDFD